MFSATRLPGCCGILVLHEFDFDRFDVQDLRRTIYGLTDQEERDLKDGCEEFEDIDGDDIKLFNTYDEEVSSSFNIYIATTVASQKMAIAALEEFGFHKVAVIPNKNTGNLITTWMFDKTEYKKPTVMPPPPKPEVFEPVIPAIKAGQKPVTALGSVAGRKVAATSTKRKRTAKRRS